MKEASGWDRGCLRHGQMTQQGRLDEAAGQDRRQIRLKGKTEETAKEDRGGCKGWD